MESKKGILDTNKLSEDDIQIKFIERMIKEPQKVLMEMKVPPKLHNLIIQAIEQKSPIKIWYDDEISWRLIEPYVYGLHKNTKNFVLRAYQIKGVSKSGQTQGWKLFLVDKIKKVEFVPELPTFKVRPEYNPKDKHMLVIIIGI